MVKFLTLIPCHLADKVSKDILRETFRLFGNGNEPVRIIICLVMKGDVRLEILESILKTIYYDSIDVKPSYVPWHLIDIIIFPFCMYNPLKELDFDYYLNWQSIDIQIDRKLDISINGKYDFPVSVDETQMTDSMIHQSYDNVVLGGTFDHLHEGHKLLLSMSALMAKKRLICGISDGDALLKNKPFLNMMEPLTTRMNSLVPIYDPFGPSITDPNIQAIVVSKETEKGGDLVNERRRAASLNSLDIFIVDLVQNSLDTHKISSSHIREILSASNSSDT